MSNKKKNGSRILLYQSKIKRNKIKMIKGVSNEAATLQAAAYGGNRQNSEKKENGKRMGSEFTVNTGFVVFVVMSDE